MVASRSEAKRRTRDSSPLDTNPKRTKVHAQRKFAQGASGLSSTVSLTPVKEKTDRSRSSSSGGNGIQNNGGSNENSANSSSTSAAVAPPSKRSLPTRGAKRPSIEDMIRFLCYRGTAALPPDLAHLNKPPSPEPMTKTGSSAEQSRSKTSEKSCRDGSKRGQKRPMLAASSAQKAVSAAQALKKKYQEQRIKKTSSCALVNKVTGKTLLRTTRSGTVLSSTSPSKTLSRKVLEKKVEAKATIAKGKESVKAKTSQKKPARTPLKSKAPTERKQIVSPVGRNRGGLRSSSKSSPSNMLKSGRKSIGSNVSLLQGKNKGTSKASDQQSKKLATSLSDFSSEDDLPLLRKHKPLVQVKKLIKKSIVGFGRKMKLEPRRSLRRLSTNQSPSASLLKRNSSSSARVIQPLTRLASSKDGDSKSRSAERKGSADSKEAVTPSHRNHSTVSGKTTLTKSKLSKMKKGYVMEIVRDCEEKDQSLETRSRRGSKDIKDSSLEERVHSNTASSESLKTLRKSDSSKVPESTRKSSSTVSKANHNKSSLAAKMSVDQSLSIPVKTLPDLRIPPSIKRPLTAVGITNPMAVAAAAAVVCKNVSYSRLDPKDRTKSKIVSSIKDIPKDSKKVESQPADDKTVKMSKSLTSSGQIKEEDKSLVKNKSKQLNNHEAKAQDIKQDKYGREIIKRDAEDSSDDNSKLIDLKNVKEGKNLKPKDELTEINTAGDDKLAKNRASRKSGSKVLKDDTKNIKIKFPSHIKKESTLLNEVKLSRNQKARKLRKVVSSEDDVKLVQLSRDGRVSSKPPQDGLETQSTAMASKKSREKLLSISDGGSETERNLERKSQKVVKSVSESSEDEGTTSKSCQRPFKRNLKPSKSYTENEKDNESESSESSVGTAPRPSTRSVVKSDHTERKRKTLSERKLGRKSMSSDEDLFDDSYKKSTSKDTPVKDPPTDTESDDEKSRLMNTKKKMKRSIQTRGAVVKQDDSSSDGWEVVGHVGHQRRRRLPVRTASRVKTRLGQTSFRSSSSDSVMSSTEDLIKTRATSKSGIKTKISTPDEDKASSKASKKLKTGTVQLEQTPKSDKLRHLSKRAVVKRSYDIDVSMSNEDEKDSEEHLKSSSKTKSATHETSRRNSPRTLASKNSKGKFESSCSENSSSESSPDQKRRVLRERKGHFSFAEVDPSSDSEEEVRAATKASLELCSVTSTELNEKSLKEHVENKEDKAILAGCSPSIKKTDQNVGKVVKKKSSEAPKTVKVGKCDSLASKSNSRKIKKSIQELKAGLNEELEKTVRSITLSYEKPDDAQAQDRSFNLILPSSAVAGSTLVKSSECVTSLSDSIPVTAGVLNRYRNENVQKVSYSSQMFISSPTSEDMSALSTYSRAFSAPQFVSAPSPIRGPGTLPTVVKSMPSCGSPFNQVTSKSMPGAVASSSVSTLSCSAPVLQSPVVPMQNKVPGAIPSFSCNVVTAVPSGQTTLPSSISLPISAPITSSLSSQSISVPLSIPLSVSMSAPLTTQMGIPIQVPVSGTMTLPLQPTGSSAGTPFLVPVQSSLTPMLTSAQPVLKKDPSTLGGMPNPSVVVGVNPIMVNNSRTIFLSPGNAMPMGASSQQMVSGLPMPSLLSLRLPDKPAQQTIVAGSPLFMPLFGSTGIVQSQSQSQLQAVSGVPNIAAMQSTVSVSANPNLVPPPSTSTVMKRQLVLSTKNGPVSNLILSVGEDGSHVLAAAHPSTVLPTTDGQRVVSVIQTMQQQVKPINQGTSRSSTSARPTTPTIAPKPPTPKVMQQFVQGSSTTTISRSSPVISTSSGNGVSVAPVMVKSLSSASNVLSHPIRIPCNQNFNIVGSTGNALVPAIRGASSLASPTVPLTVTAVSCQTSPVVSRPAINSTLSTLTTSVSSSSGATLSSSSFSNALPSGKPVMATPNNVASALSLAPVSKSVSVTSVSSIVSVPPTSSPSGVSSLTPNVSSAVGQSSVKSIVTSTSAVSSSAANQEVTSAGAVRQVSTSSSMISRIPSAQGALAALKNPTLAPASSRAIAKTGSSRKPYSTAASYTSGKASGTSGTTSSICSTSQPSTVTTSPVVLPPPVKASQKNLVAPPPTSSIPTIESPSTSLDSKKSNSEVELASTHRTLCMLSTAFHGNVLNKDRKRDVVAKKTASSGSELIAKSVGKVVVSETSGLDSLAEAATSLSERAVDSFSADKRTPEHSLWTNPAQIIGRETLKIPGLSVTSASPLSKSELARVKNSSVLGDGLERKLEVESGTKIEAVTSTGDKEKPKVSGILTSGKVDTPCQKVQKWLNDGSKGGVEHKGSCGFLSDGKNCTCDTSRNDISNLTSLAEVCVSMEHIQSPVKDQTVVKAIMPSPQKLLVDQKKKSESQKDIAVGEGSLSKAPSLSSHQMKVTWQNAFGVKSPIKVLSKGTSTSQVKKKCQDLCPKSPMKHPVTEPHHHAGSSKLSDETSLKENSATSVDSSLPHERKVAQRRSLLHRSSERNNPKPENSAFSAENESSVYAFEADTDMEPVSKPFRRRSKTLSRSDEEDSASVGSGASNSIAVQVNMDPVLVPMQMSAEIARPPNLVPAAQLETEDTTTHTSRNQGSDVYYIPFNSRKGGQPINQLVKGVAVKLDKENDDRVVMSAHLVTKPPTFKHPRDPHDDGVAPKRARVEPLPLPVGTVPPFITRQSTDQESNIPSTSTTTDKNVDTSKTVNISNICRNQTSHPMSKEILENTESTGCASTLESPYTVNSISTKPNVESSSVEFSDSSSVKSAEPSTSTRSRSNRLSSMDSDASEQPNATRRESKSRSRSSPAPSIPSTSSSCSGPSRPTGKSKRTYNGPVPGNVSDAPVFYPTEKEFQDPFGFIEKIRPTAEKYGLCRIVAPQSFKPDCSVDDEMRFTAQNQYVHKMLDRWGPNAKEMRAIVKYVAQHNIKLKHPPLVGGMELDLPRLYTTVQNFGGLMEVMDKKKWTKVAETMRIPKSAQDRASKLDEIYCKCMLPYETLRTVERDNLFEMVEVEWEMRKERRSKRLAGVSTASSEADEDDDEDDDDEDDDEDECIVKGRSMALSAFYRIARNTTYMWFKAHTPSASEVESEFWRHVRDRNFHICVNSAAVDCSDAAYGFPVRNSPFAKHPWNLKVLSNSSGSILRALGPVMGVTVPTLHFGMVFSTNCWYRDPHGLPWVEYLHTGAKKIWYGIPEIASEQFREAVQDVAPHYVRNKSLWLASDTAMIPTNMLTERKVPLCRTVQEPGQFIVVFPRAYTSSVATGYIVSENVYFAPTSWLDTAVESFREMQVNCEPPTFSLERLLFCIAEDSRSSGCVLNQILPAIMNTLEKEVALRAELKKLGVDSSERLHSSSKKKSKTKAKDSDDETVYECEVCLQNLYVSMVRASEEDAVYCLTHAVSHIKEDKLDPKQSKLVYTYNQKELNEMLQKLLDRIEAKTKKGNDKASKGSTSKSHGFSSSSSDSGSSVSVSTKAQQ